MAKIDITSKAIDSYDFKAYPIKVIKDWYGNGKRMNFLPWQMDKIWGMAK